MASLNKMLTDFSAYINGETNDTDSNDSNNLLNKFIELLAPLKKLIETNKVTKSIAILTLLFVSRYPYYFFYRKYYNLPPGSNGYPVFGTLLQRVGNHQWRIHVANKYGAITFSPLIGGISTITLNSSKLVKEIMPQTNFLNRRDWLSEKSYLRKQERISVWSAGSPPKMPFILVNGKDWTNRRKHSQATLFRTMTNAYVNKVVYESIDVTLEPFLNDIINKNDVWYPRQMCKWLAFNTIYHTMFGEQIKRDSELYHNMVSDVNDTFKYAMYDAVSNRIPFLEYFTVSTRKKVEQVRIRRNETIEKLIQKRIQNTSKNEEKTFIDYTHQLVIDGKISKQDEIADTMILFAAGTDTTSATLDFGIVLIAKHTEIQQLVRNELLSIMKNENGKFNVKFVHKCPLFRALVHEILRISSVVFSGVARCSFKDISVTVDGKKYFIPKNTPIGTNVDYIHLYNKKGENWKNIDQDKIFLENFLSDDKSRFVANPSHISFGVGRRDCVGRGLAKKEIHIILGYLLMNYKITLNKHIDNILDHRKPTLATMFVDPPIGVKLKQI
eukprot:438719_1